ncbi:MAG: M3 family metallopeptidase [Bacteroidales bacterium]|nr:M3 family metallopeptidase [Candidatus Liminaster caballi]
MENPFLTEWNLPDGAIPFDQIKVEHFKPAFEAGIEEHNAEIDAIVANRARPTFENTIEALDRAGRTLDRVAGVFYNLLECDGTDEMLDLSEQLQPIMSKHQTDIALNEELFNRVESVWNLYQDADARATITDVQYRLLKSHYESYLRNGATLKGEARERWRVVSAKLDSLTLAFSQNVQRATGKWSYQLNPDNGDLDGLPSFVVEALKENDYKLTLLAPSYRPFMTYSSRRDLREMLYKAYNTRCVGGEFDNTENIRLIAALRQETADLIGYESFADLRLADKMAKNPETVNNLLKQLLDAYKEPAKADVREVAELAAKDGISNLMPWDFSYYSEKLKTAKYNVNDEQVKPFFALDKVREGIFALAGRLYGISFQKVNVPVYHKDAECFKVVDADGSHLGLLYTDFFPRPTKRPGAWMTEFKGQWMEQDEDGNMVDSRPIIQIIMSFSKPIGNPGDENYTPSLLTYDEAETFLHEFGHAMHGMLTKCQYASQSGTNVTHDFVELPSQFNENFLGKKEFLDTFASDYRTGEQIPQSLIDRLHDAQNFQAGYLCVRQLSFGMLDMAFHSLGRNSKKQLIDTNSDFTPTDRFPELADVEAFESKAMAPTQVLPRVDGTMMATSFTHIFSGGYAAGYYGYKWAEVLDADAFAVFEKEGLDNPETARRWRHLLESGDTVDPAELYRQFKGADPTIDALMRRDGILK